MESTGDSVKREREPRGDSARYGQDSSWTPPARGISVRYGTVFLAVGRLSMHTHCLSLYPKRVVRPAGLDVGFVRPMTPHCYPSIWVGWLPTTVFLRLVNQQKNSCAWALLGQWTNMNNGICPALSLVNINNVSTVQYVTVQYVLRINHSIAGPSYSRTPAGLVTPAVREPYLRSPASPPPLQPYVGNCTVIQYSIITAERSPLHSLLIKLLFPGLLCSLLKSDRSSSALE